MGLMNNTLDEFLMEDAARLFSQALVGEGSVYVYGKEEMAAVTAEALYGKEKLANVKPLFVNGKMAELYPADRVLLLSRESSDDEMLAVAKKIAEQSIPIVALTSTHIEGKQWTDYVDIHLALAVTNSLVPTDEGDRIGYPASLLALYTYFCLFLLISEIVSEYD